MKKLLITYSLLLLFSFSSFSQTSLISRTSIDNNIIGQGIRGINSIKLKSALTSIVDYVDTKAFSVGSDYITLNDYVSVKSKNPSSSAYGEIKLIHTEEYENSSYVFQTKRFSNPIKISNALTITNNGYVRIGGSGGFLTLPNLPLEVEGDAAIFGNLSLEKRKQFLQEKDIYKFSIVDDGDDGAQSLKLSWRSYINEDTRGLNPNVLNIKNGNVGFSVNNPLFGVHANTLKVESQAILPSNTQILSLPVFSSNGGAISGGLSVGNLYRSTTGFVMIVY